MSMALWRLAARFRVRGLIDLGTDWCCGRRVVAFGAVGGEGVDGAAEEGGEEK